MFSVSNKCRIINDPVLGFITISSDLVYELVQHPMFQRLARIRQLGLANVVYPGACHTRFQHSLGAMYLTGEAVKSLRQKGHDITPAEENAVLAAMLLHDVGHGPFSHVLENTLITGFSHEQMSLEIMNIINNEMGGRLTLAIKIFEDRYEKHFLHSLISSQLDMDRMDYLCRDSFFTGVSEGAIGVSRIINMLEIKDDKLVVEFKGIYSIENFLIARRFMYWQVYLHKTSVAAEKMLINIIRRAKELIANGVDVPATPALSFFIANNVDSSFFENNHNCVVENYLALDDNDIMAAIKMWCSHDDVVLRELSRRFLDRKLFKAVTGEEKGLFDKDAMRRSYAENFGITAHEAEYFFVEDTVSSHAYNPDGGGIMILYPDGRLTDVVKASDMLNVEMLSNEVEKNYLFYLPE